jgi:hypothetical protein
MSIKENLAILRERAALKGVSASTLSYMEKAMMRESSGNEHAKAGTSSAMGLFGFTDDAWTGNSPQGSDHNNPVVQCDAMISFTGKNVAYLQKILGHEPTAGDLYLMHFAGPGGARAILTADPSKPICELLSGGAIRANGMIRFCNTKFANLTAAQLRAWADHKMGLENKDFLSGTDTPEADGILKDFLQMIGSLIAGIAKAVGGLVGTVPFGANQNTISLFPLTAKKPAQQQLS